MRNIAIVLAVGAVAGVVGGDTFCQAHDCLIRCVKSRCGVPRGYAYNVQAPAAIGVVISEDVTTFDYTATATTVTPMGITTETVSATATVVTPTEIMSDGVSSAFIEHRKRVVIDDVFAGPILLSGPAAVFDDHGHFFLSGTLIHNGGDAGAMLGGKAVVTVSAMLSRTGAAAVPWRTQSVFWVKRGLPMPIQILGPPPFAAAPHFTDVTNIQVMIEQYPSR